MKTKQTPIDDMPSTELIQVQAVMAFETELVSARTKSVFKSLSPSKIGLWDVPIESLNVLPDFNLRIKTEKYQAHIESLAQSILANGYYKDRPLTGFNAIERGKSVIYITDGHCRLEALALAIAAGAEISEVPVIFKERSTSMEDLTVALVRCNEGLRLTPLEVAVACKRLTGFGWSPDKIARSIGVTVEYVNQLLTLAGAPLFIRDMVQSGHATAAVAIGALQKHGCEAQAVLNEALEDAKSSGKTKLTTKFLPEQIRKKAFAKAAPSMFIVIEQVKTHKMFNKLPDEVKTLINEIIAQVPPAPKLL